MCLLDVEVIVIGDNNSHFGSEVGYRSWGQTTCNTRKDGLPIYNSINKLTSLNMYLCTNKEVIVPIEKAGKDPTNKDNNRGITLCLLWPIYRKFH